MIANIYCCECKRNVLAVSTLGAEVYPTWPKLYKKVFWRCPFCKNFVGSHAANTKQGRGTPKPLGCIPTKELKRWRQNIHAVIDPLHKGKLINRTKLYRLIAKKFGIPEYHTANIRTVDEAKHVWKIAIQIRDELNK